MHDLDLGATVRGFGPGQKVFGRYLLQRLLGRGGMGVVWLARDEELEREVALKFLPEIVATDPESVRDLKRETRRSLELTHPHIVRIHDFVQDARAVAISMEYVAGETLGRRKLDRPHGHFEVEDLRAWTRQLLEALDYAHTRAEVVHRDLKPANLMIDGKGFLKVADFGIAASVSESVSRVSAQAGSSGTPLYMSPQQMMGEKPAVTDDLYAVGATLYELLTGKPPFHAGNIIAQVQGKVPPPMAERRKDLGGSAAPIPPDWETAVAACLAKDPKERPQSASALAERLQPVASAVPAILPPVPVAGREEQARSEPAPTSPAGARVRRWLGAPLVAAGLPALLILCLRCGEVLQGTYRSDYGEREWVLGNVSLYVDLMYHSAITVSDYDGVGFLAEMFFYELGSLMVVLSVLAVGFVAAFRPGRGEGALAHPAAGAVVGMVIGALGEMLFGPAVLSALYYGADFDDRPAFFPLALMAGALAGWLLFRLAAGQRYFGPTVDRPTRIERAILVAGAGFLFLAYGLMGYFNPFD